MFSRSIFLLLLFTTIALLSNHRATAAPITSAIQAAEKANTLLKQLQDAHRQSLVEWKGVAPGPTKVDGKTTQLHKLDRLAEETHKALVDAAALSKAEAKKCQDTANAISTRIWSQKTKKNHKTGLKIDATRSLELQEEMGRGLQTVLNIQASLKALREKRTATNEAKSAYTTTLRPALTALHALLKSIHLPANRDKVPLLDLAIRVPMAKHVKDALTGLASLEQSLVNAHPARVAHREILGRIPKDNKGIGEKGGEIKNALKRIQTSLESHWISVSDSKKLLGAAAYFQDWYGTNKVDHSQTGSGSVVRNSSRPVSTVSTVSSMSDRSRRLSAASTVSSL